VGNTALMYAVHGNHPHCTNELLLRGADITIINLNGDTAFGIAVSKNSKLAQAVMENHIKMTTDDKSKEDIWFCTCQLVAIFRRQPAQIH
ncbi:unnamed protein product, partial [Timema podura]|nr:unnamed protein product [Timema podura]